MVSHAIAQNSAILYRTPNNRFIAADITAMREPMMGKLIPAGVAAPIRMAEALDAGVNLGMLIDQRFGRGPMVPFFGHPAPTSTFPALVARTTGAPLIAWFCERRVGVRFHLTAQQIEVPQTDDRDTDIALATARLQKSFEDAIRARPSQWMWGHRRWG